MEKQVKKKLPETVIPPNGVPEWCNGAYTIAFVYSNKGNFVLKGFYGEVKMHLDKLRNDGYKWFVNLTLWHDGRHRSIWKFWKDGVGIYEPEAPTRYSERVNKWEIRTQTTGYQTRDEKKIKSVKFKRLPKKWLREIELTFG